MKETCCECPTSIEDQTNVNLSQSLMGKGMAAYCKKCGELIRSGMNDKDDDVPTWIKQAYQSFWENFDPEHFQWD